MKKYLIIVGCVLGVILILFLYYKIKHRDRIVVKEDYIPKKEQSIEVATIGRAHV